MCILPYIFLYSSFFYSFAFVRLLLSQSGTFTSETSFCRENCFEVDWELVVDLGEFRKLVKFRLSLG